MQNSTLWLSTVYDTHRDRCVGSSRNKVVVWQKAQNQRVCVFWRIEAASSARLGGVGFLISLPFAGSVQQLPSDFVGQVWIKLTTKGEALFVCSVYMPQASDEGAPIRRSGRCRTRFRTMRKRALW